MPRISLSVCFLSLALAFSSLAQAQALQSMKAHEKLGVTCQQCHGINTPTTAPNEKQCLSCHANVRAIGEQSWCSGYGVPKVYIESRSQSCSCNPRQPLRSRPLHRLPHRSQSSSEDVLQQLPLL